MILLEFINKHFAKSILCHTPRLLCNNFLFEFGTSEWRELYKENNIVSDSDKISMTDEKCLCVQSLLFVQGYQIIVRVITSLR